MYLLVNFGGPRNVNEIESFLRELLTDRDVIRTRLPRWLHNYLFSRIAKKRAVKVRHDYELIGGKSPIYEDTEELARRLSIKLGEPVATFHRYLSETHEETWKQIDKVSGDIAVLPLFPQFCSATTGSSIRFLEHYSNRLRWVKSYAGHPAFIAAYQRRIAEFLHSQNLNEEETLLLFSAHGVPKVFIDEGDIYESECQLSFREVMNAFPKAKGLLSYQSKFGKGEWLRPYTVEVCESAARFSRKNIVVVPISFTSDHVETLFEVEYQYLPLIRANGIAAFRCPALNLEDYWVDALVEIAKK